MIGKVVSPIKPLQRRTNAACGSWISAAAPGAVPARKSKSQQHYEHDTYRGRAGRA